MDQCPSLCPSCLRDLTPVWSPELGVWCVTCTHFVSHSETAEGAKDGWVNAWNYESKRQSRRQSVEVRDLGEEVGLVGVCFRVDRSAYLRCRIQKSDLVSKKFQVRAAALLDLMGEADQVEHTQRGPWRLSLTRRMT